MTCRWCGLDMTEVFTDARKATAWACDHCDGEVTEMCWGPLSMWWA
jgi:hypothetical protein